MKTRGRSEKGQITVMIGVMMLTFILFFAFVINTGMLVNAKINLQNAADLAAYAGASVQGRQLTQISYLNYEMRRQFKKFLFRYYVIGNMAQDSFPRAGGSGPMVYQPEQGGADYHIPTVCVIFNPTDNFCHLTQLPAISIPPGNILDEVTNTLIEQLKQIELIRQNNCKAIGQTNKMLAIYWLYNTDPTLSRLDGLDPSQQNVAKIIRGLAAGLGLVPKEVLLRLRIKTLNEYVNAKPQIGLTKDAVDQFLNTPDPLAYERSVLAFNSAYYTLGNHTFSTDSISMDELLPQDSSNAALLVLKDLRTHFDIYAVDLTDGSTQLNASTNASPCVATLIPITLPKVGLTLGVYKDPSILTYYAIRLKAKAQVLFSPFGDMDLKAYSAAQPFGSRIGPSTAEFATADGTVPSGLLPQLQFNIARKIPNLPVQKEDSAAQKKGWDTQDVVGTLYQQFASGSGRAIPQVISSQDMENTYAAAMAPNPWEGNLYNIINDQGKDYFLKNFDLGPNNPSRLPTASFWAPILSPGKAGDGAKDQIMTSMKDLFVEDVQGNGTAPDALQAILGQVLNGLETYINTSLTSENGENGESTNVVKITNPFKKLDTSGAPQNIGGDPKIFMTDTKAFKTSWNSVYYGTLRDLGRVGYSVKFVSFDSLTSHKNTSNGTDSWTNDIDADQESSQDFPFLKH
jgi:Putative Flp pilus-assembly TadE/G-like